MFTIEKDGACEQLGFPAGDIIRNAWQPVLLENADSLNWVQKAPGVSSGCATLVVKLDSWSNGTDELTFNKELKLNRPPSEGNYLCGRLHPNAQVVMTCESACPLRQ